MALFCRIHFNFRTSFFRQDKRLNHALGYLFLIDLSLTPSFNAPSVSLVLRIFVWGNVAETNHFCLEDSSKAMKPVMANGALTKVVTEL
jgi:hypothetical protein